MSDSFGPQHNSIHQVLTTSTVSLSAVEEYWHLFIVDLHLLLGLDDVLGKGRYLLGEIFLIYHVEPCDQLHQALILTVGALSDVLQHFVQMSLSQKLDACKNKFEIKLWVFLLQFIDHSSDDPELLDEVLVLSVFIEEHARDMSVFNHIHILLNARKESRFDELLEKRNKLAKFSNFGKLFFEVDPNIMGIHVLSLVFS